MLPADIKSKSDIKSVEVWGMKLSPPSSKIRTILKYHAIPYVQHEGKKVGDAYQKVPVMIINGTQINDSFIMVKCLAPILHGSELTEEEIKFEEEMCYGLMICLELLMFQEGKNMNAQLRKQVPGCVACFIGCCTCNVVCFRKNMVKKLTKSYNMPSASMDKYIALIEERLTKHTYL